MNNDTDCPLCDKKIASWQGLAVHLVEQHQWSVPLEARRLMLGGKKKRTVRCWCGTWFAIGETWGRLLGGSEANLGRWAEHLKRRGGPAAHLLEITLGVRKR